MTYSSSLSISRQQRFAGRNQNAVDFRNKSARLGPVSNTVILIVMACLLGLLYLTQMTKTNAYGYQLQALKDQKVQLAEEHQDLELSAASMQSLDRVQNSPEAMAMVQTAPSATVEN